MENVILDRRKNIFALDIDRRKPSAILGYRPARDSTQPGRNTDSHTSRFSLLGMAGRFRRVSSLYDQLSCLVEKDVSRPGQLYMALVAQEEQDTKIGL